LEDILLEYELTAYELKEREGRKENPAPWLNWIRRRAARTDPIPLKKIIAKDPDDQKFIACALTGRAKYIVSRDSHLLRLCKPFGIEIMEDRQFLARLDETISP
jgi:predicted nucleic acid-binding protein